MAAYPIDPVHVYDIQTRARRRLFDTDLEAAWDPQMREVRATLGGTADWDRRVTCEIHWRDRIVTLTAAKADIAAQLLLHDVHHRAQAMAMLRAGPGPRLPSVRAGAERANGRRPLGPRRGRMSRPGRPASPSCVCPFIW